MVTLFNAQVITPDGEGYLVARMDGGWLVCLPQQGDKTHARCRHVFVKEFQFKEKGMENRVLQSTG